MFLSKPAALQKGDKLATVTLSWGGPGKFPQRYEAGKRQLQEAFGVEVVEMPHTLRDPDWIYRNPQARADDLMQAFADPSIKGIVSTIGGDESVRLLPFIDLSVLRDNPKVFLGYSDTTISHMVCLKAGFGSFYGPSIMGGFGENGGLFPYMEQSVRKTLFETNVIGEIKPNPEGWTVEITNWGSPEAQKIKRTLRSPTGPRLLQGEGVVRGPLIGGCIEVLEMLKGTDYWPEKTAWDGAILFFETSEDKPNPEDFARWIRNYGSQGILQRAAGILLGRPGGKLKEEEYTQYDEALMKVVRDELGLSSLPIFSQLDFGHTDPMFVLPIGRQAEMDCAKLRLSILESAVA